MEKMKELYEKVAKDKALQVRFAETMKDAGEAAKEKLVAFAKEMGYDVTFEEAQEFFKTLSEPKEEELSDAELDAVAGGKSKEGVTNVGGSILTLGITCAFGSVYKAIETGNCGQIFE